MLVNTTNQQSKLNVKSDFIIKSKMHHVHDFLGQFDSFVLGSPCDLAGNLDIFHRYPGPSNSASVEGCSASWPSWAAAILSTCCHPSTAEVKDLQSDLASSKNQFFI